MRHFCIYADGTPMRLNALAQLSVSVLGDSFEAVEGTRRESGGQTLRRPWRELTDYQSFMQKMKGLH